MLKIKDKAIRIVVLLVIIASLVSFGFTVSSFLSVLGIVPVGMFGPIFGVGGIMFVILAILGAFQLYLVKYFLDLVNAEMVYIDKNLTTYIVFFVINAIVNSTFIASMLGILIALILVNRTAKKDDSQDDNDDRTPEERAEYLKEMIRKSHMQKPVDNVVKEDNDDVVHYDKD